MFLSLFSGFYNVLVFKFFETKSLFCVNVCFGCIISQMLWFYVYILLQVFSDCSRVFINVHLFIPYCSSENVHAGSMNSVVFWVALIYSVCVQGNLQ